MIVESGIYGILNKINNKIYIGSSKNIEKRFRDHRNALLRNNHPNEHLQNSFKSYGLMSFEFFIVEKCNRDILLERENYWISFYNSMHRSFGYNIEDAFRTEVKAETKQKMKKNHADFSGENSSLYGTHLSEETKQKISTKAKERLKNKENHPMYGTHHVCTEETKNKISLGNTGKCLGKFVSEETRQRLSLIKKGIKLPPFTEEHKQKIGEANKGKKHTEKSKQRMREAKTGKKNCHYMPLDLETRSKIIEMYNNSVSAGKIGLYFNLSHKKIKCVLREEGIKYVAPKMVREKGKYEKHI